MIKWVCVDSIRIMSGGGEPMSSNQASQGGSNGFLDLIWAILGIIIFILLFKYIWQGITWAFDQYVDLLRVR